MNRTSATFRVPGHLLAALALACPALAWPAAPAFPTAAGNRLVQEADAALGEAHEAGEAAHAVFLGRLDAVLAEHFGAAEARIPDTLGRVAGSAGMVKLVCKMAADLVRRTDTAREAVAAAIEENQGIHCLAGAEAVEDLLAEYQHELTALDNRLRVALAAPLGRPLPARPDRASPEARHLNQDGLEKQARTLAYQTVLNEVSLIVDGITLTILWPTLSVAAARIAASAGLTVALALADGPLPFGELIGLGITAVSIGWSAAELRQAQKELRPRLEESLRGAVATCREKTAAYATHQADVWRSALEHARADLGRRMREELQ